MTNDNANQYAYDAEGRICAVYNSTTHGYTGYQYNASGVRVASGTVGSYIITVSPLRKYLLDLGGNRSPS